MMSLTDFKEKQILFVACRKETDNKIKINNENIALLNDGEIINQLSAHKIFAVFVVGEASLTTVLIKKCREMAISLFLMKNNFEVYGKLISEAEGNYLLRQRQYSLTQNQELDFAKKIVKDKLFNQLFLLKQSDCISNEIKKEKQSLIEEKIDSVVAAKELLGVEGGWTKEYFSSYFKEMAWYRRMPRAKVDIVNLLMDIGYTFLFNYFEAMLALYGFDAYKGIYHKLFFQRKSLACDLIEPFRSVIDKQITKAYHLKQINEKDFKLEKGRYFLPFDKQKKYANIFFEGITDYKEKIFVYVHQFYRCLISEDQGFPEFLMKK